VRVTWMAVLLAACPVIPARAADLPGRTEAPAPATPARALPRIFVEGAVGGSLGQVGSLRWANPLGQPLTSSPVEGDDIVLHALDRSEGSFAAAAALGVYVTPGLYVKAVYRYLGEFQAAGSATFFGDDYEQRLTTRAQAALFGLGYTVDLTERVFLDASAEIGAAFLDHAATQGANQGFPGRFESRSDTNLAVGGTLSVGYRVTDNVDTLLTGSYHYLGRVSTGVSPGNNGSGLNRGERLSAEDLGVWSVMIGLRYRM
jgi:hypothetical protein